jgi:hypothetical protein
MTEVGNAEAPHFKRFSHASPSNSFLRAVSFLATASYPEGVGRAATRPTMAPNIRYVRWLPANSNLAGKGGDSIAVDNVLTAGEWANGKPWVW